MTQPKPTSSEIPAFISVHDVAPQVLGQVEEILAIFDHPTRQFRAELLVIPGLEWNANDIQKLKRWASHGHSLAGHGWLHQSGPRTTLRHQIHSACLSRNVAEHLSKPSDELKHLISRCHRWFAESELPTPSLYVPPAWAMGALSTGDLAKLPFRFYENLSGYFDSEGNRFTRFPLLGFEADTMVRSVFLKSFNLGNSIYAGVRRCPIRVSIHPYDLDYRLAGKLRHLAASPKLHPVIATEWLSKNQG